MTKNTGRDQRIETLRGVVIVLVVLLHVCGRYPDAWILASFSSMIGHLRMPAFSAISGYIFASQTVQQLPPWPVFVKTKARRLLLPFFTLILSYTLLHEIVYLLYQDPTFEGLGSVFHNSYIFLLQPQLQMFFYSRGFYTYWFVWAMFWIFLAVRLSQEKPLAMNLSFYRWSLCFLWAVALQQTLLELTSKGVPVLRRPASLGIGGAIWLLPFFLFGFGLSRFPKQLRSARAVAAAAALLAITFVTAQLNELFPCVSLRWMWPVALVMGCSGIAFFIHYMPPWRPLAWLGGYSYGIFLYHSKSLGLLNYLPLNTKSLNPYLMTLFDLVFAVFFPIFLQRVVSRWPLALTLFFGEPLRSSLPLKKQS